MSNFSIPQLPEEPGYLIITQRQVRIPGDERSRTAPGHGYPEHTEYYASVTWHDEDDIQGELAELFLDKTSYRIYRVTPVTVAVDVKAVIDG